MCNEYLHLPFNHGRARGAVGAAGRTWRVVALNSLASLSRTANDGDFVVSKISSSFTSCSAGMHHRGTASFDRLRSLSLRGLLDAGAFFLDSGVRGFLLVGFRNVSSSSKHCVRGRAGGSEASKSWELRLYLRGGRGEGRAQWACYRTSSSIRSRSAELTIAELRLSMTARPRSREGDRARGRARPLC